MANHKSAEKAYRQSLKKNARNTTARNKLRSAVKEVRTNAAASKLNESKTAYVAAQKLLDKSVGKGIIKAGNAARLKSRLNRLVKKVAGK
ncbi:MAG TPA: 30S ribosomal protein S20 [Alphaproteobacteria bacterium]|nr:30S ribosomal protein S20 [Alphaproteobacteria bacterium]